MASNVMDVFAIVLPMRIVIIIRSGFISWASNFTAATSPCSAFSWTLVLFTVINAVSLPERKKETTIDTAKSTNSMYNFISSYLFTFKTLLITIAYCHFSCHKTNAIQKLWNKKVQAYVSTK